jgi:hypothetical protein
MYITVTFLLANLYLPMSTGVMVYFNAVSSVCACVCVCIRVRMYICMYTYVCACVCL